MNHSKIHIEERGIALLITLLIMTVLLGVGASLLNITLKQAQFSSIGLASEMAFQAANAGMECILNHDFEGYPPTSASPGKFDVGQAQPSIACMGQLAENGTFVTNTGTHAERRYQYVWGSPLVCSDITIYKYYNPSVSENMESALGRPGSCAAGVSCTIIRARGYNVACASINNPRTIEREITQRY